MAGLKLNDTKPAFLKGGTVTINWRDKPLPITTPRLKNGKQVYIDAVTNEETFEPTGKVMHPTEGRQIGSYQNTEATDPVLDKDGNPTFDYFTVSIRQPVANKDGEVVTHLTPGDESDLSEATRAVAGPALVADRLAIAKANKVDPWAK